MTNDEIVGLFRSANPSEPEACKDIRAMVMDFAMDINERLDGHIAVGLIMANLGRILTIGLQAAAPNT
ncbi:MAG TPA: hypothetical protein VIY48_17690 [Candidatus Paceibacterota bacterium]